MRYIKNTVQNALHEQVNLFYARILINIMLVRKQQQIIILKYQII